MINNYRFRRKIAMTMAMLMLPWSSFVFGASPDAKADTYANFDTYKAKDNIASSGDAIEIKEAEDAAADKYENYVVSDKILLTEDIEVGSIYIQKNGVFDLNGHTVICHGDFYHPEGTVKIGNGKLIIDGSYRIQKEVVNDNETTYESAESFLEMTGEEGYIKIAKNLIIDNSADAWRLIKDGIIEVSGNIIIDCSENSYGFVPCEKNTIILTSDKPQSIELIGDDIDNSIINNITIANTSEEGVCFVNPLCIGGRYEQGDSIVTGDLLLAGEVEFVDGYYKGNITVVSDSDISGELNLDGNLTINDYLIVSGNINVSGDIYNNEEVVVNSSLVTEGSFFDAGAVSVPGKLVIKKNLESPDGLKYVFLENGNIQISGNVYNIVFYMNFENDYVLIGGNYKVDIDELISSSGSMTDGVLEVKGDIDSLSFFSTNGHKLILSGDSLQTISNVYRSQFEKIEIQNYSDEGVILDNSNNINSLIRNNCRLRYSNIEGEYGWKLEQDQEIDGDLTLIGDTLDLNGHTLHVKGNLTCKVKAQIAVNGGELIVDGDSNVTSYYLKMQNSDDKVTIMGNLTTIADSNNNNAWKDGVLSLGGNLIVSNKYDSYLGSNNFKLVLNGENDQTLDFSNKLTIPIFENNCKGRVIAGGTLKVEKKLISDYSEPYDGTLFLCRDTELSGDGFAGSIKILDNYTIKIPYHIAGDLDNCKPLLIAEDVSVDGNLINRNRLSISKDKTLRVGGDLYNKNSSIYEYGKLLIEGKYIETGNIIRYSEPEEPDQPEEIKQLIAVTDLKVIQSGINQVTFSFVDNNQDPKVSGYAIYRDGVQIGTTDKTEYSDSGLKPETSYKYTVCAFDSNGNLSEKSEEIIVTTEKDTVAPEIPNHLQVKFRTGNTIGLSWNESKDESSSVRYSLYKNGEKIADDLTELSYSDNAVEADKVYTYEVSAVDESGNESERSEAIVTTVATPKITRVTPADYKKIGGDIVELQVYYKNFGYKIINTVNIEYKDKSGEWVRLNESPLDQKFYNISEYQAVYEWNISDFDSDSIEVRYILSDETGAEDIFETEYEIDHTAPESPEKVEAVDNNGVIELSWKPSGEADLYAYNIYRYVKTEGSDEVYSWITEITDRFNVVFEDDSFEEGTEVRYIVTAVDEFGNESPVVNPVAVVVGKDASIPEIVEIEPEDDRLSGNVEIKAYAKDNKDISAIWFFMINDEAYEAEEDAWQEIGVGSEVIYNDGLFETSINLDTTKYPDGIYYISAITEDSSGNESIEEFYNRYEIDNTGIEKISITGSNVGSTYVQIMWDDVAENDFSYFSVEKKSDGIYEEVKRESGIAGCTIEGLSPESEYTFRVCGVDTLGNKGEYSDEITLKTLADTAAPSITAVYPVQGRVKDEIPLSMTVTDNDIVAKAAWSLSFDKENYVELTSLTGECGNQTFKYLLDIEDSSKFPEGSIYIKSEAWDMAGNHNLPTIDGTDVVIEYIIDRTAPDTVKNISAKAYDGYISINWEQGSEEDISSYKVYRADKDKDNYRCVMNSASLNFYDTDILNGNSYAYYVTAVDEAGNESDISSISFATALSDATVPKVEGVSPANNEKVGVKTDFKIIVTDNAALNVVKTYYKKNEDDAWQLLNEKSVSGRSSWADFTADFSKEEEGRILLKTVCEDRNGNISDEYSYSYYLDKTAPKADISSEGGNFEIYVDLRRDIMDFDISYYEIYRCELSQSSSNISFYQKAESIKKIPISTEETEGKLRFTDTEVIPHTAYRYAAKVYDSVGNYSWTGIVNAIATDIDTIPPIIAAPDKITTIVGMEVKFDAGDCSDNVKIKSFKWDMGNGDVRSGARPKYKYSEAGTYTVKLTVTDTSGNSSQKEIEVQVKDAANSGVCNLTVVDYNGNPIPYSYIYIKSGADSDTSFMTDAYGKISLCYKTGTYTVAAFKDGYLPEEQDYKITNMKTTDEVLKLSSGEVVVGQFEVHRMSLQEIVDAGVDLTSPANINTFTFKTTLTFQKTPIPIVVEEIPGDMSISSEDSIKPGGIGTPPNNNESGGFKKTIAPSKTKAEFVSMPVAEPVPVLAVMSVTQSISWLKSMYSASLTIFNMADNKYVLEDSEGRIELPDGISLAVLDESKRLEKGTSTGQSLVVDMGDIPGQNSKTVSWTLKGDKNGKYEVNAEYSGMLSPFNVPITKKFKAETEIEVAPQDIEIVVMPETSYYMDEDYYIHYSITNKGEDPLYNFTTSIADYRVPQNKNVVYTLDPVEDEIVDTEITTSGIKYTLPIDEQIYYMPVLSGTDTITIPTLMPGQTIFGTWKTGDAGAEGDRFYGDPMREYYKLMNVLVETLEGENLGVKVSVKPIPSHVSKIIRVYYKEEDVELTLGDPVDMTTGAFTDSVNVLSLTGKNTLQYQLTYNSMIASDENIEAINNPLGRGWMGSFSSFVKEENGLIKYYTNPYVYSAFVAEESYEGKVYGSKADNGADDQKSETEINLSSMADRDKDIRFVSITHGMEGYVLTRHNDGTYELESPAHQVLSYDDEGKLNQIRMEDGNTVTLDYTEHQIKITDNMSGNNIILELDDEGKIIRISDGGNRVTSLSYTDGDITAIVDSLGQTVTYTYDDDGRIVSEANNAGAVFVRNSYDDEGRVISQTDSYGSEIVFEYSEMDDGGLECKATTKTEGYEDVTKTVFSDLQGKVREIKNASGTTEKYSYDKDGNVSSYTDSYGNTTEFVYDEQGRLLKTGNSGSDDLEVNYDERGNVVAIISDGDTATYTYDEKNNIIQAKVNGAETKYTYTSDGVVSSEERIGKGKKIYDSEGGRISAVTDELGNKAFLSYDEAGNLIKVTDSYQNIYSFEYNSLNQKVSETDYNGNTTLYKYDDYNNLISETDALGNETSYQYDTAGNMIEAVLPDGTEVSYVYDMAGNLIRKIYPLDNVYSYEYDSLGNNTKIIYPDGKTEEFTYDINGNVVTSKDCNGNVMTYSHDSFLEKLSQITDSNGNQISFDYDPKGRVTKETLDQGHSVSYTYDSIGNVLSKTDSLGNTISYEYNVWGELIKETDPNNNVTTYSYDQVGNCIEKNTPEGLDIFYTYDANYNITEIKTSVQGRELSEKYTYDPMGNVLTYTDTMGRITEYSYDKLNRVNSVKTPDGLETYYKYDQVGNIISEECSDGSKYLAEYDPLGRVISVTEKGRTDITGNQEGDNSKTYCYTYDVMGRIISTIDPMKFETSSTYDAMGNTTSVTDAKGGTTKYTYDNYSHLISEENAIGSKVEYSYDEKGYLISEKNSRGQITEYEYDEFGRLIKIKDDVGYISYSYDKNSNLISVEDASGTISRTYDNLNRVTSVTDSYGKTVKYGYDELGNVLSLTYPGGEIVRYEYNLDSSLASVTDGSNNKTRYEYDSAGRLIKTINPDGSVEEKTYDGSGEIKTLVSKDASGEAILSYEYSYDGFGNIVSVKDNIDFSDDIVYSNDGESGETVSEMKYDAANRLISFNGQEVRYDADGNMIYGPLNNQMVDFEYDARNRLIRAGDVSYRYDAENIRTAAEYPTYVEEYITDRESYLSRTLQVIRTQKNDRVDSDSVTETDYYYGIGLIYENSDDGLLIYHFDHLGSTRKITDMAGNVRFSFDYGTYGEVQSVRTADDKDSADISIKSVNQNRVIRFLYNGALGVITDDNGLLYMRQRYYDVDIKRFINQDVIRGSATESQSLNIYAYVQGNPISYYDPFGLSPKNILAPYKNLAHTVLKHLAELKNADLKTIAHDILNVISILPGPAGAIAGLANAFIYLASGDKKNAAACLKQAIITGIAMPMGGLVLGSLCKYNRNVKFLISAVLVGSGINLVRSSVGGFSASFEGLVDELGKGDDADGMVVLHYLSGLFQSGAGIVYGANAMFGGVRGFTEQCFVEGTIVKTEDGDKHIEDIREGDKVWACDPTTGETGLKEVKQTFVNETEELVHLSVSDGIDAQNIETTPSHPFYVVGYGFRYASELRIGDKVRTLSGDIYEVTSIEIEQLDEPVKVYNFEVEDWHTYYVSESGILVHNMCMIKPGASIKKESRKNRSTKTATGKGGSDVVSWSNHGYKHFPNKNQSWKDIVKSTKSGPAKYSFDIQDVEAFERAAWESGTPVTNGKNWRVKKYDTTIGAVNGKETIYVRIENSSNTIHGHPISESEYNKLLKEH